MAITCEQQCFDLLHQRFSVLVQWEAESDGSVPETLLTGIIDGPPKTWDGYLRRIVTMPGTPAPTNKYQIELIDSDGVDVTDGGLKNRSSSLSEQFELAVLVRSRLLFRLTDNVVPFARGAVRLYFQE